MTVQDWIRKGRELGASDLHIEADSALVVRVRGQLSSSGASIAGTVIAQAARELLGEGWPQFLSRGSADLSRTIAGMRCRINIFQTVRGVAMAVRLLSAFQNNLRACNLHPDLKRLTEATTGLVVISGPTGSGKSTTLAALVEEINGSSARNVIAIESPIEYLFTNRRSFIRQREIPTHSPSYEQALVDALRENPDVLVIGEMRTPEVMRLTLSAAETGHLVIATMHSATCGEALTRMCMSFPAEIQGSIRAQLADCLVGLVCQRLDFLSDYRLRVPVCEVLLPSASAKGTIRGGQFSQIANVLQTGGEAGMWNFDRYERWVAQKQDWVLPTLAAPLPEERIAAPPKIQRREAPPKAPKDDALEISIEEDASLDELAKRIEQRTKGGA
ncbi:MAG TPA: ATPase, T2SS/T4P/T4SS family [Steroidobacteraceae bacterium]|jgi:twitching motility protein PilT|nr:ATPase, T2SS/T4P/T4SS family [Steroidobacteraceae bacterium]